MGQQRADDQAAELRTQSRHDNSCATLSNLRLHPPGFGALIESSARTKDQKKKMPQHTGFGCAGQGEVNPKQIVTAW
jgi:hypothetical protein